MAKRRTRKQKQASTQKRQNQPASDQVTYTYTLKEEDILDEAAPRPVKLTDTKSIYNYDPALILADLKRTLLISGGIFAVLFGMFLASLQGFLG